MRNLTKTLAAVSILVPATAYPLGIGDIELHSALNQKLDAEIALFLSADENVSDIKVRLAPPEKFDEAGVPWSYFLSKIKFKAVSLPNGETVVKLSSRELLREPFLDFLLEVSWATGNLYREFTVLVDPPVTYVQPAIPVIKKPQVRPVVKRDPVVVQAPASIKSIPQTARKESRRTNDTSSAVSKIYDEQFGPINKFDTLWQIADRTNIYDDVSIEQMIMAIYEANPKAFYKQNVNALMAGQKLNIPDRGDIFKLSKKQALAAFKKQNNAWSGKTSQPPKIKEPRTASQLELEAPTKDDVGKSALVVNEDASSIKSNDSSEKGDAIVAGDNVLSMQVRMDKLEQQLDMMQKMLSLKDEQIATLQNHKPSKRPAVKPVVKTGEEEIVPVPVPVPAEAALEKSEIITDENKERDAKEEAEVKPVIQIVPDEEPKSTMDYLRLIIGGLIAAVLAVLGWFWWRNRKAEEDPDNESMFASASEISLPDSSAEDWSIPVAEDSSLYDVGTVGESSFLSEFTPSDFDAFDTDQNEIDPISEADVYLAYGRYQQAEELMRQAIEDDPERDECKLKLLEIFYVNENKNDFDEYAKELVSAGKHEDKDFWAKVVEMGTELGCETSIYTNPKAADLNQNTSLESGQAQVLDTDQEIGGDSKDDFDLSVFDTDKNESISSIDKSSVVEAVENMGLETNVETDLKVEDIDLNADLDIDGDIDLEMFDFSLDDNKDSQAAAASLDVTEKDIEEFDFDLDTSIAGEKPLAELDSGVSGLTSMDELETKIDLAKAYIDMGDTEAAKNIVEEVLKKGTDDQKRLAQEILDRIQ